MMKKDNDHIDEIFKDAFDGMEAAPNEGLWDNIADDISEEKVDDLFKEAFSGEMAQPSDKVWDGVKEHLPLDLRLKRSLNSLSIIAGIVVIGMLVIISFTEDDNRTIIPTQEEAIPEYNINIAIEEVEEIREVKEVKEEVDEVIAEEAKVIEEEALAVDNSIKDKIQSVKLNEVEEEFVFDVDEEKMKGILKPIAPLPLEYAVASSLNGGGVYFIEAKEEITAPKKSDAIVIEVAEETETATEGKEKTEE